MFFFPSDLTTEATATSGRWPVPLQVQIPSLNPLSSRGALMSRRRNIDGRRWGTWRELMWIGLKVKKGRRVAMGMERGYIFPSHFAAAVVHVTALCKSVCCLLRFQWKRRATFYHYISDSTEATYSPETSIYREGRGQSWQHQGSAILFSSSQCTGYWKVKGNSRVARLKHI